LVILFSFGRGLDEHSQTENVFLSFNQSPTAVSADVFQVPHLLKALFVSGNLKPT
jgi:hypothetical protein